MSLFSTISGSACLRWKLWKWGIDYFGHGFGRLGFGVWDGGIFGRRFQTGRQEKCRATITNQHNSQHSLFLIIWLAVCLLYGLLSRISTGMDCPFQLLLMLIKGWVSPGQRQWQRYPIYMLFMKKGKIRLCREGVGCREGMRHFLAQLRKMLKILYTLLTNFVLGNFLGRTDRAGRDRHGSFACI